MCTSIRKQGWKKKKEGGCEPIQQWTETVNRAAAYPAQLALVIVVHLREYVCMCQTVSVYFWVDYGCSGKFSLA